MKTMISKRVIAITLIFSIQIVYSENKNCFRNFLSSAIVEKNMHHMGLEKLDELAKLTFEDAIPLYELSYKQIMKYPDTTLTDNQNFSFIPVTHPERGMICMLMVHTRSGELLSVGYRDLAIRVGQIIRKYKEIPILYKSYIVGPYLVTLPSVVSGDNLTAISPGWNPEISFSLIDKNSMLQFIRESYKVDVAKDEKR